MIYFKIIFEAFSGSVAVNRPSLVNWYWTELGRAQPTSAPKITNLTFGSFSSFHSFVCFRDRKKNFKIFFCSFHSISCKQPTKFGNLIFNRFCGVLCQSVHPESNTWNSHRFSLFDGPPWFLLKTVLRLKMSNFKIIFAFLLLSVKVIRPSLVNWFLTDFVACSANWCTQNGI